MIVQCLQGLNIFVITELTIAALFAQVFVVRHLMTCCRFLSFFIGLTCGLLKNHKPPSLKPTAPVQYQSSSIIAMIVLQE
jgi:hypothetical protein